MGLSHELRRPRRIIAAALIFLLLGGAGGALVGLAAADDEDRGLRIAAPNQGDSGIYRLVKEDLDDDARYRGFDDGRELSIAFRFDGAGVAYAPDGSARWAFDVVVNETDERRSDFYAAKVDPETHQVVFMDDLSITEDEPEERASLTGTTTETGFTTWRTLWFLDEGRLLPCGLLSDLQGREATPDGWKRFDDPCSWGPGDQNPNASWRRIRGLDADGLLVVDFTDTHPADEPSTFYDDTDWRAWFAPGVPYPVRMQDLTGGSFAAPGDVLELTDFQRGLVVLPLVPPMPLVDLPPLQQAPRQVWGLDDTGVDHPWPFSEAFRWAVEDDTDPGVRDYLADHPGAYVAFVSHAAFDSEGHTERWSFTLTDGPTRHSVVIAQDRGVPFLAPGVPMPLADEAVTYRHETPWEAPVEDLIFPAPDQLPAELPTAASLLAQWEVILSETAHPAASPSWQMSLSCGETRGVADCDQIVVALEAGHTYYYRDPGPLYPVMDDRVDAWVLSWLEWDGARLERGGESLQVHTREQSPVVPLGTEGPGESEADPTVAALPNPYWAWPSTPAAAGVGFLALLVSLLYYLWPALKAGPLALFSRIQPNQVLEHPERARVHQAIQEEPGIHHNALMAKLGMGNGALRHHMDKLVSAEEIVAVRNGGFTCYFVKGTVDRRDMAAAAAVKSKGARDLLAAIRTAPGATLREAAGAAGLTPQTASYHVGRLERAGLVSRTREGRTVRLHAAA
ncbi:MAG: winged helix-turn-helix transcriptional regulator [Thermoplasmatota archaeon]